MQVRTDILFLELTGAVTLDERGLTNTSIAYKEELESGDFVGLRIQRLVSG